MEKVDYIIVGQGLSGTSIAQRLIEEKLSFKVIDRPQAHQASRVASGIWNPIVLKRMKKVWLANIMLSEVTSFYTKAQDLFQAKFIDQKTVHRLFQNPKEVDNWLQLSDEPAFEDLIADTIKKNTQKEIEAPNGLGEVIQSGRIDTIKWLESARLWIKKHNALLEDEFDHTSLNTAQDSVSYKGIVARAIIFCEGMRAAKNNPFFINLPFALTKGEVLIIRCPGLHLEKIINSSVFLLPLGNDLYKVGATYNWKEQNTIPTEQAKEELLEKVKRFLSAPFEVIEQKAGIRPTVKDRRPLLGTSAKHPNVHIFNGMGSRGVLMAPYLSKHFLSYLKGKSKLLAELDITRFNKKQ